MHALYVTTKGGRFYHMQKCRCGCGNEIPRRKLLRGALFVNRAHFMKWRSKQIELGIYSPAKPRRDSDDYGFIDYSKGVEYCKDYNNDDIKCVVCFEQHLINKNGGCK